MNISANDPPDHRPTAAWPMLRRRAELLGQLRTFFADRGFLEVETPVLSADTVVDVHLDPFEVHDGDAVFYLQTSPEFGMKRLLASVADDNDRDADAPTAIYQVSRVFRRDERGPLHNPEFTMVEWYRVGDNLAAGMSLLGELAATLLPFGPAERVSYADAFAEHAGVDAHRASVAALRNTAERRGINVSAGLGDDRDAWLDLLLVELVAPHLGAECPTILFDYPASQAALAVTRDSDPSVAERFELYVRGIELANGYHELTDADELRRRNHENNAKRAALGKPPLPEMSRLLDAMEAGLPPCCGCALGFDRLLMLAIGARSIDEVIALPFDRA
ncbi:MAG: EF-P lysine aminoacylase GenX [Planctomycetales bacterium]|nr:EF-P lysine aminoacylase GenX [Planctomycetales bacterium]